MQQSSSAGLIKAMPWVFVLIWSTGFIVARFGMPVAPALGFLSWRYLLSVLAFGLWLLWSRPAWPQDKVQWLHLAVTGVLTQALYLGGVWLAIKGGMSAGLSALVVGFQPVLTALWVSLWGHRVRPRQWLGLALGFLGLALVVWPKLSSGLVSPGLLGFVGVALMAITCGTLYQKKFCAPTDARVGSFIQLSAAFVLTLPLAVFWEQESIQYGFAFWSAMAWAVLALSLGASSLFFILIQRGAATSVTSLLYLVPPVTAVLGWLLFNEALSATTLMGMGLTAFGVWLVVA